MTDSQPSLQAIIDDALSDKQRQSDHVYDKVHFAPIGEDNNMANIISLLDKRNPAEHTASDRMHIGVAGGFNFSIATRTRPAAIVLLDVNENQRLFWNDVIALLARCNTPEEFRHEFKNRISEAGEVIRPTLQPKQWNSYTAVSPLKKQSSKHHSFLTTDDTALILRGDQTIDYLAMADWLNNANYYEYLHTMAQSGKIAAATVDIVYDKNRAETLGYTLKEQGLVSDTCYWSNVSSHTMPHHKQQYTSVEGNVMADDAGGLEYPFITFYRPNHSIKNWDGAEVNKGKSSLHEIMSTHYRNLTNKVPMLRAKHGEVIDQSDLPPFEQFLRRISAIGGGEGTHMLIGAPGKSTPMLIDGPPRHLKRIEMRRQQALQKAAER